MWVHACVCVCVCVLKQCPGRINALRHNQSVVHGMLRVRNNYVLLVYVGSGFQSVQSYTCLFKPTPSSPSSPASFTSPSSSSYLFLFRPLGVVLSERRARAFNMLSDFSPRALPAKAEEAGTSVHRKEQGEKIPTS